jgi:hypothetical protein
MQRLAPAAAAFTAVLMAACATGPAPESSTVVRTRAPQNFENTVTNYFDLMVPNAPASRKLVFGTPEASPCVMFGRHLGWVVPVVFDVQSSTAATRAGARPAASTGSKASTASSGTGPITLDEVSITGTRFFFWFNNDTLGAVTRRADLCP